MLINILIEEAKSIRLANPDSTDVWGAVKYKGIEFDINVYGGEFTDDGSFRATAYVVFDGNVDTSARIDLGDLL